MSGAWRPTAAIETLIQRATLLERVRSFFRERDVIEVQTATLDMFGVTDVAIENIAVPGYGFLQSSPEYQMKRLLAAGMPSCYQIGPVFRAGEVGRWHDTEFTMLEWYRLGFSLEALMAEVGGLVDLLLGHRVAETITVGDLVNDAFGLDIHQMNEGAFMQVAAAEGYADSRDAHEAADFLIERAISQLDASRVFLTEYPADQAALAKIAKRGNREVALRFELIVGGLEIANGYDELLDVAEFRRRCASDNARRASQNLAQKPIDRNLEAAMAAGLPECCGVAVGLDRLFALALDKRALREVSAFGSQEQ